MKIVCDNCGAKYRIADDKVRGNVFKIRCQECDDVIVVKGTDDDGADDSDVEADADVTATGTGGEWYAVIEGEQVGPVTADEIEAYFEEGVLDAQSYAWREGLDDWEPLEEIDAFEHLFGAGRTAAASGAHAEATRSRDEFESGFEEEVKTRVTGGGDMGTGAEQDIADLREDARSEEGAGGPRDEAGGRVGEPSGGHQGLSEATSPDPVEEETFETGGSPSGTHEQTGSAGAQAPSAGSGGHAEVEPSGGARTPAESGTHQQAGDAPADRTGKDSGRHAQQSGIGPSETSGSSTGGEEPRDDLAADSGAEPTVDRGAGDGASVQQGGFESFEGGESSTASGGGQPAASGSAGGGDADLRSSEGVGERSEDSVLFSLSSVDEMEAVDSPESEGEDVSGAGAATEGSGLIDIQSLSASHAAMSTESEGGGGGGAAAPVGGADISADAGAEVPGGGADTDDAANMPSLNPSGSSSENTGLVLAIVAASFVLGIFLLASVYLYVTRGSSAKSGAGGQAVAARNQKPKGGATGSAAGKSGEPGGSEAAAEGGGSGGAAPAESGSGKPGDNPDASRGQKGAGAEKQAAARSGQKKGGDESAKKQKKGTDEAVDQKEAGGTPSDESDDTTGAVASADDESGSGGDESGGESGGRGGSAERDRGGSPGGSSDDSSDEAGGGGKGGDDIDGLLSNVGNEDEGGGSSGDEGGGGPSRGAGGDEEEQKKEKQLPKKPTRSMVKGTIGKYMGRVEDCAANENRKGLSGSLFVKFEIQPSGAVRNTSIETAKFKGTDVGKCVEKVVQSMNFPKTQNGMPVKFPFPVE
ncbi:MAG: GYF domain-containing protein [Bradymonadaceae bacterium]